MTGGSSTTRALGDAFDRLGTRGGADLAARAIAIADRSMFAILETEGIAIDDHRTSLSFTDENCLEVSRLDDASPAMREAFDWCRERGYVELPSDNDGEFVSVLRRPGEQ